MTKNQRRVSEYSTISAWERRNWKGQSLGQLRDGTKRAHRGPGGTGGSVADSVWSCKKEFGSACKGLPADKKHAGKQYCVLHFPSVNKDLAEFAEAIEKKVKANDF